MGGGLSRIFALFLLFYPIIRDFYALKSRIFAEKKAFQGTTKVCNTSTLFITKFLGCSLLCLESAVYDSDFYAVGRCKYRRLGSAERCSGRGGWFNVRFSLAEGLSKSDLRRVNVRGSGGQVLT